MQARLVLGRLLIGTLALAGIGFSAAARGQTVVYPPPFVAGMASGAQFGAQVSAAYPSFRCSAGSCGAHFDPRPILAGALIGGLVSAFSTPIHYPGPYVPRQPSDSYSGDYAVSGVPMNRSPSLADTWLQPQPSSSPKSSHAPFVDSWQRFFEPSQ